MNLVPPYSESHEPNALYIKQRWKDIQLNRHGRKLYHFFFFFSDDLLLFTEADLSQAQVIKSVLSAFEDSSYQKVDLSKIKYFSQEMSKPT